MRRGADARLWAVVTATVRPLPGRKPPAPLVGAPQTLAPRVAMRVPAPPPPMTPHKRLSAGPAGIEPNRLRLIERGREPLAGTIDLHGLTQDAARAALTSYLSRAYDDNRRTVLVITGKGSLGDGVLRRRVPEWLAEPPLRGLVSGLSEAHRKQGGAGALYVALKRKAR
jgi:DNA-nicking Smr family endonuclease